MRFLRNFRKSLDILKGELSESPEPEKKKSYDEVTVPTHKLPEGELDDIPKKVDIEPPKEEKKEEEPKTDPLSNSVELVPIPPKPKPIKKRKKKKKAKKKTKRKSAAKVNKEEKRASRILTQDVKQALVNHAKFGYSNAELGLIAGVSRQAIELEAKRDANFGVALKASKLKADRKIEQSLYKRAKGMKLPETKVSFDRNGVPSQLTIDRHYPPSETAIQFWLKNRQREKWGESTEEKPVTQVLTVVNVGGKKTDFDV